MNSAYPTLPIPKNRPPYTGCSPSTLTSCSGDPCTASIASTSAVQEATKTAGPGVQRRHGPSSASVAMTTMMTTTHPPSHANAWSWRYQA